MLFPTANIISQDLKDDLFEQKQVRLTVLRLDAIDPVASGNKLFKLHFFLQNAYRQASAGIVTFGGAFSNHLLATAYTCKKAGLKSVGIIRGERPPVLSHTLTACLFYGMELKFISRSEYDKKDQPGFLNDVNADYNNYIVIPEGGYHPLGALGASLISDMIGQDASHICCAVGTGTTLAGLLPKLKEQQQLLGIPVLKNMHDLGQRIEFLTSQPFDPGRMKIINNYHFGGYAKKTPELVNFINLLYKKHGLPTDFVYTGKMMFGIIDYISKDLFPKGSNIVCIHTGGLQGNTSLPTGTLVF